MKRVEKIKSLSIVLSVSGLFLSSMSMAMGPAPKTAEERIQNALPARKAIYERLIQTHMASHFNKGGLNQEKLETELEEILYELTEETAGRPFHRHRFVESIQIASKRGENDAKAKFEKMTATIKPVDLKQSFPGNIAVREELTFGVQATNSKINYEINLRLDGHSTDEWRHLYPNYYRGEYVYSHSDLQEQNREDAEKITFDLTAKMVIDWPKTQNEPIKWRLEFPTLTADVLDNSRACFKWSGSKWIEEEYYDEFLDEWRTSTEYLISTSTESCLDSNAIYLEPAFIKMLENYAKSLANTIADSKFKAWKGGVVNE